METLHHPDQPPSPTVGFNLNHHHQPHQDLLNDHHHFAKEHMFEKPLTPSDVGKLNRLVIPKQHAEKYFPLGGGGDAADQQKGLLLSFEDESGKLWRFRYSYWNSSQSYVLTKGWSRYVKEKRLDAGDVVLFERHSLDCEKMFIGWRRRSAAVPFQDGTAAQPFAVVGGQISGWSTAAFHDAHSHPSLPLPYQPDHCLHAGVYENVDNCQSGVVATRRLRLFGVNLECPYNSEPSRIDDSSHVGQPDHQYGYNFNDLYHNMQEEQQEEEG